MKFGKLARGQRKVRALAMAIEAMEQRTLLSASLTAPTDVNMGQSPFDVVVADLNGDGQSDLATANSSGTSISIRYGNPSAPGSFSSIFHYPMGSGAPGPEFLLPGDLDGDGDIDFVAVDEEGTYVVYENTPASNNFRDFDPQPAVVTGLPAPSVSLVDIDNDGNLDLLVYGQAVNGIESLGIRRYLGNGNLGFASTPEVNSFAGDAVGGFIAEDLDGDGARDYIAAYSEDDDTFRFTVMFNPLTTSQQYSPTLSGAPQTIAAGDFNGDGKPDLLVSTGTTDNCSILYYQNSGAGGFGFSGDPVTVYTPPFYTRTLDVADIDGDGNLDVVMISGETLVVVQGKGDGTFATTASTVATNAFPMALDTGDFDNNGKTDVAVVSFTESNVAVHFNNSTPGLPDDGSGEPEPTAPALTTTVDKVTLPTVFVPGDKGTVKVLIANSGATAARGTVNVDLFASTDATLDGSDIALDIGTSLDAKSINVGNGRSVALTAKFVAPATLANGTYYLIARVTPSGIDGAIETTGASATTFEKVTAFGQVGARRGVKYSTTDADGTLITYTLAGPGTATVNGDTITIDGSTIRSKFVATTKANRAAPGSDAETSVSAITVNGPIGAIVGKGLQITGGLSVAGDVKSILLEDIVGATADVAVSLNGSAVPVAITLDDVTDASITSTAGIKVLKAESWVDTQFGDDTITAPYLTSMVIEEDFAANLTLSGAGAPRATSLASAKVLGNLNGGTWAIASGNVSAITVNGSVLNGWTGNIAGNLKALKTKFDFSGRLAAANITAITVGRDVAASTVRAGYNFGADNLPDTSDDTGVAGIITKLSIKNSLSTSTFWAGADTNGDPLDGGLIKAISAIATVGLQDVEFVAAKVPVKVKFDGEVLETVDDPRFTTLPL